MLLLVLLLIVPSLCCSREHNQTIADLASHGGIPLTSWTMRSTTIWKQSQTDLLLMLLLVLNQPINRRRDPHCCCSDNSEPQDLQ